MGQTNGNNDYASSGGFCGLTKVLPAYVVDIVAPNYNLAKSLAVLNHALPNYI